MRGRSASDRRAGGLTRPQPRLPPWACSRTLEDRRRATAPHRTNPPRDFCPEAVRYEWRTTRLSTILHRSAFGKLSEEVYNTRAPGFPWCIRNRLTFVPCELRKSCGPGTRTLRAPPALRVARLRRSTRPTGIPGAERLRRAQPSLSSVRAAGDDDPRRADLHTRGTWDGRDKQGSGIVPESPGMIDFEAKTPRSSAVVSFLLRPLREPPEENTGAGGFPRVVRLLDFGCPEDQNKASGVTSQEGQHWGPDQGSSVLILAHEMEAGPCPADDPRGLYAYGSHDGAAARQDEGHTTEPATLGDYAVVHLRRAVSAQQKAEAVARAKRKRGRHFPAPAWTCSRTLEDRRRATAPHRTNSPRDFCPDEVNEWRATRLSTIATPPGSFASPALKAMGGCTTRARASLRSLIRNANNIAKNFTERLQRGPPPRDTRQGDETEDEEARSGGQEGDATAAPAEAVRGSPQHTRAGVPVVCESSHSRPLRVAGVLRHGQQSAARAARSPGRATPPLHASDKNSGSGKSTTRAASRSKQAEPL
eukprot:g1705.t1